MGHPLRCVLPCLAHSLLLPYQLVSSPLVQNLPVLPLIQKRTKAIQRARKLDAMRQRNGTIDLVQKNPSSGIYELIEAIYAAFSPRS